ncbi:MAG TPA: cytochrome bc complex cytochrome b subunit [Verrucomicrobiales bacterium]|nr:cytochrome bc complex cytochrome b subunit [Verrucomicrobiales bacterium]
MKWLIDWLDHRTGHRKWIREALFENIPGGSQWRYVWGSTLTFTLFLQVVTGLFLWMSYSPGANNAWESVYFIQYEMNFGWLLRGIHHYAAQLMIILLVLHLMQVMIDGAYKAPREINFWFGLLLLQLTLALSLTGYLLPWDQKGFWATKVATSLLGVIPVLGDSLQKLVVGGSDYGHLTLTRFFVLHAGVLPGLVILLVVFHIYLFRRHGIKPKEPKTKPDEYFWPQQVFKDSVACLAVLVAILLLIVRHRLFDTEGPLGAELGAPADPSQPYDAARPEWYFLFLFQFLKYFKGGQEIWGAIYIPMGILGFMFLMPFIGKWKMGHRFNLLYMMVLAGGAAVLTGLAIQEDRSKPELRLAIEEAHQNAERVLELAQSESGIPVEGAVSLLWNDPLTQGPRLFARHCASCHRFGGKDGMGRVMDEEKDPQTASDLKGFATREWLTRFLNEESFHSPEMFGGTQFSEKGKMRRVVSKITDYDAEEKLALEKVIVAISAEASLPMQKTIDENDLEIIIEGRRILDEEESCMDCHLFHNEDEETEGPVLTGYGSEAWLIDFVGDPTHSRFYGEKNDRMPAFLKLGSLDLKSIELIVKWLREDWYRPESTP